MKNSWLFKPVDISSLIYFRIVFGLVMLWEVVRYFEGGRIASHWITPEFYFYYPLFEWLQPWPGNGMYIHFAFLGLLALFIALGLFYRFATILFFLSFSYFFLLDETHYLNHFYLITLVSFLMIFLPLNRKLSLDVLIWPKIESETLPAWTLWLTRFQIGIPYFFGGIAKLNLDWLQGEPMRIRLARRMDFPIIGQFFDKEWIVYLYSYGGLLLDLLAVPLLLWRRTRLLTFFLFILFHFNNARMFNIGIFPWLMIAATTIYFDPTWPKAIWNNMCSKANFWKLASIFSAIILVLAAIWCEIDVRKYNEGGEIITKSKVNIETVPILIAASAGLLLIWGLAGKTSVKTSTSQPQAKNSLLPLWKTRLIVAGLSLWCLIQIFVPLRHYLYPSNVHWSEEGHRFAWHMMLRDKKNHTLRFLVSKNSGGFQQITSDYLIERNILTEDQLEEMATRPYMIHQFVHYLAEVFEGENHPNVKIQAISEVSLNGRKKQLLLDPSLDFAGEPIRFWRGVGIMPLTEPLKNPSR